MKSRIMYIEQKEGTTTVDARIGRVEFSKTGRTMYYKEKEFAKVKGFKYNCIETSTNDQYWISGCKKNGNDSLYSIKAVSIDDDVREEYWLTIRKSPELRTQSTSKR